VTKHARPRDRPRCGWSTGSEHRREDGRAPVWAAGGRSRLGATQGEGRGRHHKTLVVGVVEIRPRKKAPGADPNIPGGNRAQHRGGHGRSFIAARMEAPSYAGLYEGTWRHPGGPSK